MRLLLTVLVFNVWLPKGGKEKKKGRGKVVTLSIPLEIASDQGGGACSDGGKCVAVVTHLRAYTFMISSSQWSEHWSQIFIGPDSYCPCWLPQAESKPFEEHTQGWLPQGWGWGVGSHCWAKAKIPAVYPLSFPLEVSRIQKTPKF